MKNWLACLLLMSNLAVAQSSFQFGATFGVGFPNHNTHYYRSIASDDANWFVGAAFSAHLNRHFTFSSELIFFETKSYSAQNPNSSFSGSKYTSWALPLYATYNLTSKLGVTFGGQYILYPQRDNGKGIGNLGLLAGCQFRILDEIVLDGRVGHIFDYYDWFREWSYDFTLHFYLPKGLFKTKY